MAKVTIELVNCLKIAGFDLFDFDYPIADTTWKEQLEADIINYFYFHEIGQETIDRFKHVFSSRLKLIMPYYNELFLTKVVGLHPLLTHDLTETTTESSVINSTNSTQSETVFTDYPEHSNIALDIASNKGQGNSSNDQNTATTHDFEKTIRGYSGVNVGDLLSAYRKTIININQMIIDDLKQCFILIY